MTEWLHLIVSSISRSVKYEMKVDCSFVDRPYVPEHLNIDRAKDTKHEACLANIIDILWQDVQSTEFRLDEEDRLHTQLSWFEDADGKKRWGIELAESNDAETEVLLTE
jgi:hypothetical protein